MRWFVLRRLLLLLVVAIIAQGAGRLYRHLGAPYPGVLAVGTALAPYGLLWLAAALDDWRRDRRSRLETEARSAAVESGSP